MRNPGVVVSPHSHQLQQQQKSSSNSSSSCISAGCVMKKMTKIQRFLAVVVVVACFLLFISVSADSRESSDFRRERASSVSSMSVSHGIAAPKMAMAMEASPPEIMMDESASVASDNNGIPQAMGLQFSSDAMPLGGGGDGSMETNNNGRVVSDSWNKAMNAMEQKKIDVSSRMLVHEGRLTVEIWQGKMMATVVEAIRKIVESNEDKSYTEEESLYQFPDNNNYYYNKRNEMVVVEQPSQLKGMSMRIRVASELFDRTMDQLRKVAGEDELFVTDWHTSSRDVTDSYIDAASRANVVDASRQALQVLLIKAQSVQDVFAIEKELTRLTEQYESHKQRAQALTKESSWSTISIEIREKTKPVSRRDNNGKSFYRFTPWTTAQRAMAEVIELFADAIDLLVYVVVFSIPIMLLMVFISGFCCSFLQKSSFFSDLNSELKSGWAGEPKEGSNP